jgi:L-fuconolactonase
MAAYQPKRIVDSHQHLWVRSERPYEWLLPEYEALYRDYRQSDIQQELESFKIGSTVLVQAGDSYADTFFLLGVAKQSPQIKAVVGWVALDRPEEAAVALDIYSSIPVIKGVRALTHSYEDNDWIAKDSVSESLNKVADLGFSLDYVGINPEHRKAILKVARAHPNLKIALDHFTKPDIANQEWQPWADAMAELATLPNVYSKVSGLNTLSKPNWSAESWKPYVEFMVENFGSERLMIGSDWPFSRLNGEFAEVWNGLVEVLSDYSPDQQDDIYFQTAEKFYRLS